MSDIAKPRRASSADVARLKSNLRRAAGLAVACFILGVVMSTSTDQVFAAFGGVIAAVSVATFSGCVYAHLAALSYAGDRTAVRTRFDRLWPYASRAAAWGVFAAGLGVLLSEAIPTPLRNVPSEAMSTSALLAVTFAGVGIALAILEVWRDAMERRGD